VRAVDDAPGQVPAPEARPPDAYTAVLSSA